ncbi:tRNA-modifying protein YgfZ [Photobacterium angustum]|uniref:tRNA-modifying protein YgfZ n=1 Tax=Photobacterium angustum TaxID=661 RepID=UPI0005E02D9F|nr:tRNA-modifying protein YgfZ [Photobacterium angustum]KJG00888.1 folate-dependent regulatory protein [Photobacterium angustum]KJG16181.1 folate-dependent regulatory protein [Photobacterium angustum]KJG22262.1 folate-dependent regulatory protein [Photobacterium angustum]KJG28640.1 folate-dependent regulatory protein [Photobacterium angustum]PSV67459.1 tRNA-modifying protein YgfZ [Photobacterium angustum]
MSTWSTNLTFSPLALSSQDPLPALALSKLDDWGMVTLIGADSKAYLQGQLTCDLVSLEASKSTLAAHCDAKGKMRTVMRIFHIDNGYGYLQRQTVMATQIPELKKYAVFSKTDINQSTDVVLGLSGEQAQSAIDNYFTGSDDVRHNDTATAVKVDNLRWFIITPIEHAETVAQHFAANATLTDAALWNLYDIKAALPRVEAATELEFIPQAMNLQAVNGISFKKGCYTGQETVARAKYRGINKRAMYIVSGESTQCPQASDALERSVGENWRKGGTVITGYQFNDQQALALVVLPNDLDDDAQFRFASQPDAIWEKHPLPYALDDDA